VVKKDKKKQETEELEEADVEPLGELEEGEPEASEEPFEDVPEIEQPKTPEEIIYEAIDKLEASKRKIIDAVAVNQKYIKKIWARQKEVEDNFKILMEKLEK